MAIFRVAPVIVLLAVCVQAHAMCPIGEGLSLTDRPYAYSGHDRTQEAITYRPAGQMADGTIVMDAVDRRASSSEAHQILFVRPATELSNPERENRRPVTIDGEQYVIEEKMEHVTIDHPCDGTVSVQGDEVIFTIAAP